MNLSDLAEIHREQYNVLYSISKLFNTVEYRGALISNTLDAVMEVIHAERGLFVRYDHLKNQFHIICARHTGGMDITNLTEFSSGILNKVLAEKQPCLYHNIKSDPNLSQFESVQIQQIESAIGIPVLHNGEVWGVILVDSRENRADFNEENLQFLGFFGNLVSLALDRIIRMETLKAENLYLRRQVQVIPELIGESPCMKRMISMIYKVAPTDATVLLLGESGTGKDLVARAVHNASPRKRNAFLAQFCGSIPDSLLESELFGYKKGAFTGANTDKKGLFETAHQGTFFLDEIADISMALQGKLLRVIQNQEIMRVGDTKEIKIDVRIVAATNKDLGHMVKNGQFRQDLYYRLNVFPIHLPPLRERRDDIPLLADFFIKKYSEQPFRLTPNTMKKLVDYHWPGNVRQLENTLRRALILCEKDMIEPDHIILDDDDQAADFSGTLDAFIKILLQKRLNQFNGNRTQTAKSLNVSVRWVQLKVKEYQLSAESDAT
jgi:Nif-specific regulatory protein